MKYELKIALRFLKSGRTQTLFIILGIAIGVAVQIFLGSLITSLQESLVDKTVGNSSHITVKSDEDSLTKQLEQNYDNVALVRGNYYKIEKKLTNWRIAEKEINDSIKDLKALSPVVQGTGIIIAGDKELPIQIKGIELTKADPIYDISKRVIKGSPIIEGNNIVIGKTLADEIGASESSIVSIIIPTGENLRFLVSGIFDLENESVNSSLVFMDLSRAQKLFQMGGAVSALEIQIADPFQSITVYKEIENAVNDVIVEEWQGQNQQLLSALKSQSSSSYTIQFFVILAVTLGIASVLAVSVIQKSKEIGILKAMGATKKSASRIFVFQGLILGIIGSVIGSLAGILLINLFQLTNRDNGGLIIEYKIVNIIIICFIAIFAGTFASLIPARKSASLNPMEAIKNG